MSTTVISDSAASNRLVAPVEGVIRRVTRIALVGPDGVGKSTVISVLGDWFHRAYPNRQFLVRQWRPGLLPDLGCLVGKPAATAKAVRPRRQPGRLHLLRVFYYYWDFLIGSWWRDRVNTRPRALVLYDRCALDMQVDPVRFALRSALGTRFLARFTPKPDLVILLEDTPERIWERKRELQLHEIREQLDRWRRLAETGQVHAIVRVDDGPHEIAARIWQLVVDVTIESQPEDSNHAEDGLQSIEHILNNGGRCSDRVEEFVVLPSQSYPRFLAPVTPRAAAANSMEIYNPQTWAGRIWRRSTRLALRAGMAQFLPWRMHSCVPCRDSSRHRFSPERLGVGMSAGAARMSACATSIFLSIDDFQRFLARAARFEEAVVSVSLGTPGVHRKPVFQVMDQEGRIRAFAKAGWNDATNELVRREAEALRRLSQHAFSTAIVPSLLDAGWYNDSYVLVMGAAEGESRLCSISLDDRHLQFLVELHGDSGSSSFGRAVAGRIPRIYDSGSHYYAHVLEYAIERQSLDLPAGFAHGDFCPWNIRMAGGKLLVFDWEYFEERAPLGSDLFHFLISSAIELQRKSGADAYRIVTQDKGVHQYFQALGLSQQSIRPFLIAYLTEVLSRNLVRFGNNPSFIDRQARRAWATMLNLAVRSEGAAQ